ncbi:MAG: ABC transporter ATP-binding protein [Bacillota bacterium]
MMKKRTFRRIFNTMGASRKFYLTGLIGMSLAMFLFQTQIAFMFRTLFDTLETGDFSAVIDNITVYLIIILIVFALFPLFSYLALKATVITTGIIRKKAFTKLTRLPMRYFKERHSAEISSRLTNDIAEMERAYTEHLMNFFVNLITGLGTGVVMFFLEWRLALVALAGGALTLIVNTLYAKRLRKVSSEVQTHLGILNTKLSNIISGIPVIRIFNIQKLILDKFHKSNTDVYDHSRARVRKQAVIDSMNAFVGFVSFVGLTVFGAYLVLLGQTTVGVIVAVVQLQSGVLNFIRGLGTFISNLQASLAAGDRIFEIIDEDDEPKQYHPEPLIKDSNTALQMVSIRFSYLDSEILSDVSFSLKRGASAALVGPSGSGKSTIFKLLLQFYPSEEGRMLLNDGVSTDYTIKGIRERISYVPQNAHVFQGTIRENIAYGNLSATNEAIVKAAKDANAHAFIKELKDGYETIIGENGTTLSGGQRQRIAIARAFLKDAPILLLDEATSALDNTSERLVKDAIERLMKDKTSLVIAHRLSTIKDVDTIFVLDHGEIVEEGNHDTLMKNGKLYAELVQTQLETT